MGHYRHMAIDQVRKYLAALPPDSRRILKRIREDIRATAPGATEHFSYGIPGFKLDGKRWCGMRRSRTT
jgi:uncharacterized protein YdhG (YjbR/CyaY superfamily)